MSQSKNIRLEILYESGLLVFSRYYTLQAAQMGEGIEKDPSHCYVLPQISWEEINVEFVTYYC